MDQTWKCTAVFLLACCMTAQSSECRLLQQEVQGLLPFLRGPDFEHLADDKRSLVGFVGRLDFAHELRENLGCVSTEDHWHCKDFC